MSSPRSDAPQKECKGFWKYYLALPRYRNFLTPFVIVVLISAFVVYFENTKPVLLLQAWSLDRFFNMRYPCRRQLALNDVYLVSISDSDYRSKFKAHSPLDRELVIELIQNVLHLKPSVVGIDLDTKDPDWYRQDCEVKNRVPSFLSGIAPEIPVVWEQMAVEANVSPAHSRAEQLIQPYQILGGCTNYENAPQGMPRYPMEADGVARLYQRIFHVPSAKQGQSSEPAKSFARTIAEEYATRLKSSSQATARAAGNKYWTQLNKTRAKEEKILNFDQRNDRRNSFHRIQASRLLDCNYLDPKDRDWLNSVGGDEKGIGKIVLIGGEFSDARDDHNTPLGEMSGLELNAYAIESELQGGMIAEVRWYVSFFLDWAFGTLFVAIFWYADCHHQKIAGFLTATAGTLALALIVSFSLFEARVWLSFIPIWLGVNIHQYFEHGQSLLKEQSRGGD